METSSWLALAPLVVLVLLVAAFRTGRTDGEGALREEILGATLLVGASIALGTELLGQFRAISAGSVLVFWLGAIAGSAAALTWRWARKGPPAPVRVPRLGAVDGFLVAGIVATALALLVVAWLSPPQSSDSIGYHMTRVMHWIQNGSLAHYPTADPPQLFEPPFAEMVRLHLYLLTGGDRAGCLLQWFAAMGALSAASLLARDLGGGRRAQIFAAVFALTLPIGAAQASSGKNGWVEALWLLSLAHFGRSFVVHGGEAPSRMRMLATFAALGLELMTKISAWLFAPPLVILAIVRTARAPREFRPRLAQPIAAGVLLVSALALPYLARNFSLYGHPLVDPVFRQKSGLERVTPAVVVSNMVRNALFQFGTTSAALNQVVTRFNIGLHDAIGLSPSDPGTTQFGPFRISAPTKVEEVAFSPLHILLVFGAGAVLIASRNLRTGGERTPYLLALAGAYVLYSAAVQWQPPSCRLLMPLLVLAAPLVAVVMAEVVPGRAIPVLAAILFAACLPYATNVEARPLSFERGRGVLARPRRQLYFARVAGLRGTYGAVAQEVIKSRTRNLGVVFTDDGEPEYLLWMLLKAARPRVRIQNVLVTNASGRLASSPPFRDFRPELVVVFASDPATLNFEQGIVVAGRALVLVQRIGSAGVYAGAGTRREP